MPWMFLHRLTDADARAIATYLKALPPVRNTIPDPLHYGTLETLAVKLTRPLPAVPPRVLTYTEGNFGAPGGGLARDVPQRVLVGAQWVVVVAGGGVVVVAGPPRRRGAGPPRGGGGGAPARGGGPGPGPAGGVVRGPPRPPPVPPPPTRAPGAGGRPP